MLAEFVPAENDLRAAGVLNVVGAFAEPGADQARVAPALAGELRTMAGWLGLGAVNVAGHGDLAPGLRRCVHAV